MSDTVKSVFDKECKDLVIDKNLVKRIHSMQTNFVNKNLDHISFFGGNLLGVQVVRFLDSDRDRWFSDVLMVDEGPLDELLVKLDDIHADRHVASDTMNLSCVWLAHAVLNSNKLTDRQKHEAMVDIFLILQYKFLTSRLFRLFKYPADKAVAEATYALLSYKYALKTHGSWLAMFVARSEDIISKDSIHYETILNMKKDTDVTYVLSDTQGRIRDMLKNMYDLFLRTSKEGTRISTTSNLVEHDGIEALKDKTKAIVSYTRYINSIVTDKETFIKKELTEVIEKLMHTMPPRLFHSTLEWMANNYRQPGADEVEQVLNTTIIHCFDYLSENRNVLKETGNLSAMLSKLRGAYMSSRSSDDLLMELRTNLGAIVHQATGSKNDSTVSSIRTGVLLYIALRTLTMHHYTQL